MNVKNVSDCVEKHDIKCDGGLAEEIDGGVTGQSTTFHAMEIRRSKLTKFEGAGVLRTCTF